MIDFDMLAAQCAPHVAVATLRQQQYYVGVAFDVYISGALWQRVRPGVSVSGEAGVTYVGTATGGSMQPRFEPPPALSGGSLPFFYPCDLPANASTTRVERRPI